MSFKPQTNVRLSDEARAVLVDLADRFGVSQAAVVEVLLDEEVNRLKRTSNRTIPLRWRAKKNAFAARRELPKSISQQPKQAAAV